MKLKHSTIIKVIVIFAFALITKDAYSFKTNTTKQETTITEKEYKEDTYSNINSINLSKNIVNGKNVLTQDMLSKPNTTYIIQHDYNLQGKSITIPENCVLDFQGGNINNGKIIGNNTSIRALRVKIFSLDINLSGSWNVTEAYPEWFGAKGNKLEDDTESIKKCLFFKYIKLKSYAHYIITDYIKLNISNIIDGNGCFIHLNGSNAGFEMNLRTTIKNIHFFVATNLELKNACIIVDGDLEWKLGYNETCNIINVTGEQQYNDSLRRSTFIHLRSIQKTPDAGASISGIHIENIRMIRFKYGIKLTAFATNESKRKIWVTSNIIKSVQGFNCHYFIYNEILGGKKASMGGNVFNQCHFQPNDNTETYFVYSDASGDDYSDCAFWDSERPSNKIQIKLNGDFNRLTGHIPSKNSAFVQDNGNYNYFLGDSYSSNAVEAPMVRSSRGYIQEYKISPQKTKQSIANLTYDANHKKIVPSADKTTTIYEYPLDLSIIREGHTIIEIESYGSGGDITCNRQFLVYENESYITYSSHPGKWSNTITCKLLLHIRKYANYTDINYLISSTTDSGNTSMHFAKKRYTDNSKTLNITLKASTNKDNAIQIEGTIVKLTPAI